VTDVSIPTVLLSAGVSVVTGFIGALLSASRQRLGERRIYGLALLAEVKSIRSGLVRFERRLTELSADGVLGPEERDKLRSSLRLWRHDVSVYSGNSGRIGLFSVRVAVELIEFYHRVRWLDAGAMQAPVSQGGVEPDAAFAAWASLHLTAIRETRRQSRYLGRMLRQEVPATWSERLRGVRRSVGARLRRRRTPASADGQVRLVVDLG